MTKIVHDQVKENPRLMNEFEEFKMDTRDVLQAFMAQLAILNQALNKPDQKHDIYPAQVQLDHDRQAHAITLRSGQHCLSG